MGISLQKKGNNTCHHLCIVFVINGNCPYISRKKKVGKSTMKYKVISNAGLFDMEFISLASKKSK